MKVEEAVEDLRDSIPFLLQYASSSPEPQEEGGQECCCGESERQKKRTEEAITAHNYLIKTKHIYGKFI